MARELSDESLAYQLDAYLRLRERRGMTVEQFAAVKELTIEDANRLLSLLNTRDTLDNKAVDMLTAAKAQTLTQQRLNAKSRYPGRDLEEQAAGEAPMEVGGDVPLDLPRV